MGWLMKPFELLKKVAIDWFLKDQLKTLPKQLEGYKTTVGILLSVVTVIMLGVGSNLPYAETIQQALDFLVQSFSQPLTAAENKQAALALQLIYAQLLLLYGLGKKAWKWRVDYPQKPVEVAELAPDIPKTISKDK